MNKEKIIQALRLTIKMIMEKRVNGFNDSLPIADRERAWDAGSALKNVENWATSSNTGKIDFNKFGKAFLWYDSNNSELIGSYKLQICDIINGKLTVIPRALFAVRARLNQTMIPATDKEKVTSVLKKYYDKMGIPFE